MSIGVFTTFLLAHGARAQESKLSEDELRSLVEQLKERVDQLEATVESLKSAPPLASPLDERVDRLEQAAEEAQERDKSTLSAKWNDSLRIESEDGRIKLRLGVRLHMDFAWYNEDDGLGLFRDPDLGEIFEIDQQDGAEFRRARLYLSGTLYDSVEFKTEYDFAGGDAGFRDVYLAYVDPPWVDKITIGRFKEPLSLEELGSDNDLYFMERSLANVFVPSRNIGAMVQDSILDGRATWAVGVFRDTDDYGRGSADGNYNWTARVTALPWYDEERGGTFHLGAAASVRNPDAFQRFRSRPESHITSARYVDTGTFYADDIDVYGLESGFTYGPLSLQGEYIWTDVDTRYRGERTFSGYYLQAAYMLTGEHRPYDKAGGVYKGIKPLKNFSWRGEDRGWGAWELALRYSRLDLQDGPIRGGEETNLSAGVKWYLNPQTRVMLEYIHGNIDHDLHDGDLNVLQARFQFYF